MTGPDVSAHVASLRRSGREEEARTTLANAVRQPAHRHNVFLWNQLLVTVQHDAVKLEAEYERMHRAGVPLDVVTGTIMMHGYGQAGRLGQVLAMRRTLVAAKVPMDQAAYGALIAALAHAGETELAWQAFEDMQQDDISGDVIIYNMLIDMFGKAMQPERAWQTFMAMNAARVVPSVVTFNTLIDVFSKSGHQDWAWVTFTILKQRKVLPDSITLTTLLSMCRHYGRADAASDLFDELPTLGVTADEPVYCHFIDTFVKAGRMVDAWRVFDAMRQARIVGSDLIYCRLIDGSGMAQDITGVQRALAEMRRAHVPPSEASICATLGAYYSAGRHADCIAAMRGVVLSPLARALLAEHHRKLKQYDAAVRICEAVLKETPTSTDAHHRAWIIKQYAALHTGSKAALVRRLAAPPFGPDNAHWCRYLCLRVYADIRDADLGAQRQALIDSDVNDGNSHIRADVQTALRVIDGWERSRRLHC